MNIDSVGDDIEDILAELDGCDSNVLNKKTINTRVSNNGPQKAPSALHGALKQVSNHLVLQ